MKTIMSFAAVALLAAGCSTAQPIAEQQGQATTYSSFVGLIGPAGPRGETGPTAMGAKGPFTLNHRWTSYKEFWFDFNRADLHSSEMSKVSEIAAYMSQNPSHQVGIDGSLDPRGNEAQNDNLSDRRISAVRDVLIHAGVPSSKIKSGAFGDTSLRQDRRVEVLISSAN